MVPVRSGLVGSGEVVKEGVASGDGALIDESGAISPVGVLLEQTVPMLDKGIILDRALR